MITIIDAIKSLRPKAQFVVGGEAISQWHDTNQTQPSESEIQTEILRLQAEYDSLEYARLRQNEYPSIQECVHAILDGGLDELQAKRQAVKERFPK